ncbi:MAG: efflux RND transporter periplasmic adaptor subunit [Flavipsychrobacter sp.]|nr:efflux RND transporter periplasmic adaptor subunit [Flavipsychrobacter sp.]
MKNLIYLLFVVAFYSCNSSSSGSMTPPLQSLPVVSLQTQNATLYQDFNASLEGTKNIDLRPQVDGYLQKIYVDEGAHVHKGQILFQVDDKPYQEQLNNAKSTLLSAKANLENAQINVDKLTPLLKNNLISDVQVKTAKAAYDAAKANVAQAEAIVNSARINLGYTTITALVDGYIGRIPYKIGSLVSRTSPEPLTVLSEIQSVYAYFSLSENDFIQFKEHFPGKTVEEKLKQMPPVQLVLPDNTIYPERGTVEIADGQFNKTMGTISFRAIFPNANGLLRSGNTGKIRVPQTVSAALIVPQEATYEIQDKVFVFLVNDSNKVASQPINITGRKGNYYLVNNGVKSGDKIVYAGLDRLKDGAIIKPETLSMDSLLRSNPL